MKNRRTQGFTLIELLIVIAIIGILAAVLIPNLLSARKRAYDTGAAACANALKTAEAQYQIDKNVYVSDVTKLDNATIATQCQLTSAGAAATGATITVTAAANLAPATGDLTPVPTATAAAVTAGTDFAFKISDSRGSKTYALSSTGLGTTSGVQ